MSLVPRLKTESVAIVGGGMLGMTLALRLAQAGRRVTLYEAASEFGGLAGAWRLGDVVWDKHYHVTLLSDSHLRALLEELELDKEMRWVETRTGFYTDGKLYSMSNTLEFLRFPPLGILDKLRLGATIFYASRIKDWRRLESVPVAAWLAKLSGKRTFPKIWLPLLRAKLGENYARTNAAFIWATIARMYAARRTGLKKEMFGYLPGGYARLLARFAEKLEASGVKLKLNHKLRSVRQNADGKLALSFENGASAQFDEAILTAPSPVAAQVCECLNEDEKEKLAGVEYQGIVCASLLLKKPLAEFYVTNITEPDVPFTAVIEMTALVDPEEFGGRALVYLPKYTAANDETFALSDDEIKSRFLAALRRMYEHFSLDDVEAFRISRVRNVFPLPVLDYSAKLPPIETSVRGMHIVNSSHIVNGTLNVNETVQLAERAARELLAESQKRSERAEKLSPVREIAHA